MDENMYYIAILYIGQDGSMKAVVFSCDRNKSPFPEVTPKQLGFNDEDDAIQALVELQGHPSTCFLPRVVHEDDITPNYEEIIHVG